MKKLIVFFIFLFPFFGFAQIAARAKPTNGSVNESLHPLPTPVNLLPRTIVLGDTLPYVKLNPVVCYAERVYKNKREAAKWTRLKYNVKKVYPYAILAAAKLKEYDKVLSTIKNENERNRYTKKVEKELKEEFGEELKNLTMTQGRILLKLIDRETGKTTYTIVKDMRGNFSAFMWQSLSLLFNSNLKDEYDAEEEDLAIEQAIRLIESGDF